MAFEGPLEDQRQIRELMDSYSDTAFRQDLEGWLAMWSEECAWKLPWGEARGKAALRAEWPKVWTGVKCMGFFTQVGAIEVQGDSATARCYCREILLNEDGAIRKLVGAYSDQLVREGGNWRFKRRDYELMINEA
jgi:ketosteroid isomerase-like protein